MKKLLFIGNSHTYFNDMPHMVTELFRIYQGEEVFPVMLTQGGMTLRWHADQPQTRFNLQYGGYDYVVFQQATHPFDGKEALIRGAKSLLELVPPKGTKPVAYMTWAQKSRPQDQAELTDAFIALAKEEGLLLAPAGMIWEKMRNACPEAELYYLDGAHTSRLGAYLAAVSIMMAISGRRELPFQEDAFYSGLSLEPAHCRKIHQLAGEVFSALDLS